MKIPCDCCRPNGMRKNMITKVLYLCNYCQGTKLREAPLGYNPNKKPIKEAETRIQTLEIRVKRLEELKE